MAIFKGIYLFIKYINGGKTCVICASFLLKYSGSKHYLQNTNSAYVEVLIFNWF